ncbi:MAG: hypothetical protein AAF802_33505, partial [Planctomycetota bacterium]
HSLVTWLLSQGIEAYAVEDQSAASLYMFGTIGQFHAPKVFVDRKDIDAAIELVKDFEAKLKVRRKAKADGEMITSRCEECGVVSEFPSSLDGTTQTCPSCGAYMDVGSLGWAEDFDFGIQETESVKPLSLEDAMDAALVLNQDGDWQEAIEAYRDIASKWPDHAEYAANCIKEIKRKIDAAR